jgi:hypothetical protein
MRAPLVALGALCATLGSAGVASAQSAVSPSAKCSADGCIYGGGGGSTTPGAPVRSSGGGGGGSGGGGATTCTATDFTTKPPQKVTGPITSKPAFGTGGEWQYPEGPAVDPPGPNGETDGRWYVVYCGGVTLDEEYIPIGTAPPGSGGIDPAAVVAAAMAHLPLHAPTIHMNPDPAKNDALVGLPTWFWVDGGDVGTVPAGAAHDGVVVSGAVSADHIVVDPGDGTGTFTCPGSATPWAPGATNTNCSHTYTRSSAGKGRHNNFTVTVTVVWSGNYTVTVNGAPLPGGGLGPVTETSQAPVRVAEAQSINTG